MPEFDLLPKVLARLFTGAVAGLLAGLLAVGSGIVIVPPATKLARRQPSRVVLMTCSAS